MSEQQHILSADVQNTRGVMLYVHREQTHDTEETHARAGHLGFGTSMELSGVIEILNDAIRSKTSVKAVRDALRAVAERVDALDAERATSRSQGRVPLQREDESAPDPSHTE
ncbi:hypothetical protein [Streptomyces sp. cg35]|uniref:hypothetical protein n=1 Tax=Streptomyces sp. cg35 TaxID=3421650 RepID=UPI003D16FF04